MTNRTVQFWGQGYSIPPAGLSFTPCTITATVNGNVVFSGSIPTAETSDIGRLPSDQQVIFSFEIPDDSTANVASYTLPVSLEMTGECIYLEQILANYAWIYNPVFSAEQLAVLTNPSSTQAEKVTVWEATATPALTSEEITLLSSTDPADQAAQYAVLTAHGILTQISSGASGFVPIYNGTPTRSNIVCTGATYVSPPPPDPRPVGTEGTWGYEVEPTPGETAVFSFDMTVSPGHQ